MQVQRCLDDMKKTVPFVFRISAISPVLPLTMMWCLSNEQRKDHPLQGSTGTPSDAPPCVTHSKQYQLIRGPVEGATGRAHLVRATSSSDYSSHNISLSQMIVCGFPPPKLLGKPRYGAFHIFAKTPRDDPAKYTPHRNRCLDMGQAATCTQPET